MLKHCKSIDCCHFMTVSKLCFYIYVCVLNFFVSMFLIFLCLCCSFLFVQYFNILYLCASFAFRHFWLTEGFLFINPQTELSDSKSLGNATFLLVAIILWMNCKSCLGNCRGGKFGKYLLNSAYFFLLVLCSWLCVLDYVIIFILIILTY